MAHQWLRVVSFFQATVLLMMEEESPVQCRQVTGVTTVPIRWSSASFLVRKRQPPTSSFHWTCMPDPGNTSSVTASMKAS